MQYEDPDIEIRDLDYFVSETNIHTTPAIIAFVKQFHEINNRWDNRYEPVTEGIITLCAEMQENILEERRPGYESLSEIDLILVSALRILGLSYNIADVDANLRHVSEAEFHEAAMFVEPEDVSIDQNPSITISRHDPASSTLAEADGTLLATLIQELVGKTQRLLIRGRFRDLPVLICVLYLLKLIEKSITCVVQYIDLPNLDRGFAFICNELCRLYDAASKGHNPLVDAWDRSEYAKLVGLHTLALAHFEALNNLWVDGGMYHVFVPVKLPN